MLAVKETVAGNAGAGNVRKREKFEVEGWKLAEFLGSVKGAMKRISCGL